MILYNNPILFNNKETPYFPVRRIESVAKFYRKCCKLTHICVLIHIADKELPTLWTKKNGAKNATVTQQQTGNYL